MLKVLTVIANVPEDYIIEDIQDCIDDMFEFVNHSKYDFYIETVESVEEYNRNVSKDEKECL
jgi:hypothetical protein